MKHTILLAACLAVALASAPALYAQDFGRVADIESNLTTYHFYTQPGAATVQVTVLGTVRNPGMYEVRQGTNLRQLLALSGGPVLASLGPSRRRAVTLQLYRPESSENEPIFDMRMDRAITNPAAYPVLQDGDVFVIEVDERRRFSWRDIATAVGTTASVVLLVERLSN